MKINKKSVPQNLVVANCKMHETKTVHAYTPSSSNFFSNENEESLFRHWTNEYPLLPIKDEKTNDIALKVLDKLMTRINSGEATNAEQGYFEVLTDLISRFELEEYGETASMSPVEFLRYLMDINDLKQEDLIPEFGTQSRVSEFLNNKRELSKSQIRNLSKRFRVNPSAFMS